MMSEAVCCTIFPKIRIRSFVELLLNAYLCYLVAGTAKDYRCVALQDDACIGPAELICIGEST